MLAADPEKQQIGEAYKSLKAQLNELMMKRATMAEWVACHTYKEELKEKDERIRALEQQLRAMHSPAVLSPTNHEDAAKVDRNDLPVIHRRYAAVLSTLQKKKMQPKQCI